MRRTSFLVAFGCLLSLSAAASAQILAFDLPGGKLGDSVVALGQQARISIGVRDPALARLRVPSVRGRMSVEAALARMLASRTARAVRIAPSTWVILPEPKPPSMRSVKRDSPPPPAAPPRAATVAPQDEPQDIVVTGSKRGILLAAYPGAATLVDGRDFVLEGLVGSDALAERVPALTSTHLGPGRNKLFIRGIADSSFNGPTQATVGQYLGETRLNYNAPDPDLRLYDIERIEILPGPQGTLYGAGSLGGVIRIIPKAPAANRAEAAASAGFSLTAHGEPGGDAAAMLNLPLAPDRLALRLVGYAETEGGYIDDLQRELDDVNRTNTVGGRAALRAVSDNGWQVDLGLAGQRIRGEDSQFSDRGAAPLTRRSAVAQNFGSDYLLADVGISRNWGNFRLVSTLGYVRQKLSERYDSTLGEASPTIFDQTSHIRMLSMETRLSRDGADGTGWLVGASLVSSRLEQERAFGAPDRPTPITGVRNAVNEATLFGEVTVKPAEALRLAVGGRLTRSNLFGAAVDAPLVFRTLIAPIEAGRTVTNLLPSLAMTFRGSPELLFFLRYQQGFRPGGLAVTGEIIQRFRNDRIATTEMGLRYKKNRITAAASMAHTRWRDIQADVIDLSGLPTTQNIGDGRIWTLDLRFGWNPLPGLTLDFGAVFNESRVTNPVPTIIISPTAPLPNVARANGHLGIEHTTSLLSGRNLRLTASARYVGSSRLGVGPILGDSQGGWLDTRLGARLEGDRNSLSVVLSNVLDQAGNRFAMGSPFTLIEHPQVTPLRPRTLRVGWDHKF